MNEHSKVLGFELCPDKKQEHTLRLLERIDVNNLALVISTDNAGQDGPGIVEYYAQKRGFAVAADLQRLKARTLELGYIVAPDPDTHPVGDPIHECVQATCPFVHFGPLPESVQPSISLQQSIDFNEDDEVRELQHRILSVLIPTTVSQVIEDQIRPISHMAGRMACRKSAFDQSYQKGACGFRGFDSSAQDCVLALPRAVIQAQIRSKTR